MNLVDLAVTKYLAKRKMDLSEQRINRYEKKMSEETDPIELETLEKVKLQYIGVYSQSRQVYMEMMYLTAHLPYQDRIRLQGIVKRVKKK